MIFRIRELAKRGVLSMNRRNAEYILPYNRRRLYPLVDDKLRTKELAIAANIAVPELYGAITTEHDIRKLPEIVAGKPGFVIKPANGAGGDGIMVIVEQRDGRYRKANRKWANQSELAHHVSNILSGMYSLGGHPDKALVEYRVEFDPIFEDVSFQGVPDVRTIVFLGYPVMAMVRLPTRQSDGKANLHQGAVGVGVDIGSGKTRAGVCNDEVLEVHPDTERPFANLEIPGWPQLLDTAARCYELTGLGYLGVDMVLDRDRGPLILELNARPGLSIQLANREGLLHRLRAIERIAGENRPAAERVAYARRMFGMPPDQHDAGAIHASAP